MKRYLFLLVVILTVNAQAQSLACETKTLGELSLILEKVNEQEPRSIVRLAKYCGFDFDRFRPVKGTIRDDDFFEIGYDERDSIVEVSRYIFLNDKRRAGLKIIVRDIGADRVLFCKLQRLNATYGFIPIAIIMPKAGSSPGTSFLINLNPQFGDKGQSYVRGTTYDVLPRFEVDRISVIMILGRQLEALQSVKLSGGRIIAETMFYYNSRNEVDSELVYIFASDAEEVAQPVTSKSCISELRLNQKPDFSLILHPKIENPFRKLPIWIYEGAHDYAEEFR